MVCFPSNSSPSESGANCLMEIAVVAEYQVNHSRRQRNRSQVISLVVAENKKENRKFKRNSPSATLDTKTSIVNYFINLLGLVIKKKSTREFLVSTAAGRKTSFIRYFIRTKYFPASYLFEFLISSRYIFGF